LNFNIDVLQVFEIFGVEVWITQTIVNTWIIMLILIVLAVAVRIILRKFESVPKGLQNFIETAVEAFDGVVKKSAGPRFMNLGGWYFMVFAFILVSSLASIFGLRPPTADFATTFAFAMVTFVLIQYMGVRYRKGKYLISMLNPLNLIGELARPLSLSFRLFGNMLAGMILMSLVYALFPVYLQFIIPAPLHFFFDIFFGVLQTYIFCVLSLTFIGSAADNSMDKPSGKKTKKQVINQ